MYLSDWVNQAKKEFTRCLEGSGYRIDDFVINVQEEYEDPFISGMFRVRILYKPTDTVKFFNVQLSQDNDDLMIVFCKILTELKNMINQMSEMKGDQENGSSS